MRWCRLLICLLVAGTTQAFSPAPIRWGGLSSKRFVIMPAEASLSKEAVPPQALEVGDPNNNMFSKVVPHFTARADGTITWDDLGWCLEASGSRSGDEVRVNRCTGGPMQVWNRLRYGQLQLKRTNQCLSVERGSVLHGSPIKLHECENRATQAWTFDEPPHELAPSQFVRHVSISGIGMYVVGLLTLLVLLRHRQKRDARAMAMVQHDVSKRCELGEVSLLEPFEQQQINVLTMRSDRKVPQPADSDVPSHSDDRNSSDSSGAGWTGSTSESIDIKDVPADVLYHSYADLSRMTEWSPALESVTVDPNDPRNSVWVMQVPGPLGVAAKLLGYDTRLSWQADLNAPGLPSMNWTSTLGEDGKLKGMPNAGFVPSGSVTVIEREPGVSTVTLTLQYTLPPSAPDWQLSLVQSAPVQFVVRNRILAGLKRFAAAMSREWAARNVKT